MHDQHPAGPVHVLQKDSPNRDPLTACGLCPSGRVYNAHGGPTSCPDCLEVLAEEVERALVPVLHRFRRQYATVATIDTSFRTYCGKAVSEYEIGNGIDRPFTCPDCNVNFETYP